MYNHENEITQTSKQTNISKKVFHENKIIVHIFIIGYTLWERCLDFFKNSPKVNPFNSTPSDFRVRRGGGWPYEFKYYRMANRYGSEPEN